MALNRFYVISPLALIALSACRSPYSANTAVNGNIVKGPLSNALVFLDLDGDNVLDANEQSVRTDADGKFSISTTASSYKIVALTDDSTVDTSSGSVLAGVTLTAPKGASVVTPTTTLMEEGGLTAEQVAEVLDLPDGVDPLTFNPFAAGVDATKALAVEKVSQQIMTAVSSFASAAEGAGASEKGAFTAALNSVVDVVKVKAEKINDPNAAAGDKKIDFTKTADLDLIKAKVADEAEKIVNDEGTTGFSKAALTSLVNDTATSIKNVNDQIGAVSDLTSEASKNVFSNLQVLQDQVKNAAIAEKVAPGSGSIDFKDPTKVTDSAKNKAPTEIKLSIDTITEGSSNLLIGKLQTVDSDAKSGDKFKYEIVELTGTDFKNFSMDKDTGAFSFKETPVAGSYKVVIKTTDALGKSFAKEVNINVQKDFHKDLIAKIDVTYSDVKLGETYFDEVAALKTDYSSFISNASTEFSAIHTAMMTAAQAPMTPTPIANPANSSSLLGFEMSLGNTYSLKATVSGLTPEKLMDKESSDNPMHMNNMTVDKGFSKISYFKDSNEIFSLEASNSSLTLISKSVVSGSGKVNKIILTGDFSKFDYSHFGNFIQTMTIQDASSSSTNSTQMSVSSETFSSGSGNEGSGGHSSSSSNSYSITKASIFKEGSSTAVASSETSSGKIALKFNDYDMSVIMSGGTWSAKANDIFNLATLDFLDLNSTLANKMSGSISLSHKNTEILKMISDLSQLNDSSFTLGSKDVFGVYNDKPFVADSNFKAAAYFDFGSQEIDQAAFEKIWADFDGELDLLPHSDIV